MYKTRKPTAYRHPELDLAIRRQRTMREADLTRSARSTGVSSPRIFYVDMAETTLVMEYVEGARLKELMRSADDDLVRSLFTQMGDAVARLHSGGMTHGDLTTANVLVRGGEPVFIDFGLASRSTKTEDHAVDLRLIKETLAGAHQDVAQAAFRSLLDGYSARVGGERARTVVRQLRSIESRGRYARVA